MRLVIVSHTPHYRRGREVVGWAPTIREISQLASRFTSVRHVACLYDADAPDSAIPYAADNVELVPVPPAGAAGALGKLDALRTSPRYAAAIRRELAGADLVHVRAPANIALVAMVVLAGRKTPVWFKYAGNWRPDGVESPSYTLQRWWLRAPLHRGLVTVNGRWPDQPSWVRSFNNPSLDEADLEQGARAAAGKALGRQVRLVFVGQLLAAKGAGRALDIVARVRAFGIDAQLELVGDGAERAALEQQALALGLGAAVRFAGWQPPARVRASYASAHFVLLPSSTEGWPKVLSEGMAYGAVPLAGAVSAIPQILGELGIGAALHPTDIDGFANVIARYIDDPSSWSRESARAVRGAAAFSYRDYLRAVDTLLHDLGLGARGR